MSKQFWAVIAGIVIILVGVFILTSEKKEDTSSTGGKVTTTNHVKGATDAKVKLVEYGDFQCPYCSTYHGVIDQVMAEYGDRVSFQFVHWPLPSLHQNAFAAHRAAEAASKQGKFWEMYDKIFENADPNAATGWVVSNAPSSYFDRYAKEIGLNMEQYKKDFASSEVNKAVNADMAAGNKLDVQGTPTFFVNGKKVTISNTYEDFKKVLDAELKKQTTGEGEGATSSGSQEQSTEKPAEQQSTEQQ